MILRIILFLALNFGALAIGSYFTSDGVSSEWYRNLNQAPWTPPGWMFGAAWTTIMICFAIYMAYATKLMNSTGLIFAFGVQWILNLSWNPIFFYYHNVLGGLIVISALAVLVCFIFYHYRLRLKEKSLWLAPYVIWILIATSLNAYIYIQN